MFCIFFLCQYFHSRCTILLLSVLILAADFTVFYLNISTLLHSVIMLNKHSVDHQKCCVFFSLHNFLHKNYSEPSYKNIVNVCISVAVCKGSLRLR